MADIKKTDAKFLVYSGLLFKINQYILHPFGLALEVIVWDNVEEKKKELKAIEDAKIFMKDVRHLVRNSPDANECDVITQMLDELLEIKNHDVRFGGVWDYRDDPEGMLYEQKTFESGLNKYKKFMDEFGNDKLEQRKEKLGYIIQEEK